MAVCTQECIACQLAVFFFPPHIGLAHPIFVQMALGAVPTDKSSHAFRRKPAEATTFELWLTLEHHGHDIISPLSRLWTGTMITRVSHVNSASGGGLVSTIPGKE